MTNQYLIMRVRRSAYRRLAIRTALESVEDGVLDLVLIGCAYLNWFLKVVIATRRAIPADSRYDLVIAHEIVRQTVTSPAGGARPSGTSTYLRSTRAARPDKASAPAR